MKTGLRGAGIVVVCGFGMAGSAWGHAITLTVRDTIGFYGPEDTVVLEVIAGWDPDRVGAPASDPTALASFRFRVDAEPGLMPVSVTFNPELFDQQVTLWDADGVEILGGQLPPFLAPDIDRSNPFTIATIEFELLDWPQLNEVTIGLTEAPSVEVFIDELGFQRYGASVGQGAVKVEPTIVYAAGKPDFDSPCGLADFEKPYFEFDISDVFAFLTAFGSGSGEADLAAPSGVLDFNDVVQFLVAFERGCFYWG